MDLGYPEIEDIWDSDLDPSDTLKLSADTEMPDWFLERDVKIPPVILNDKLISDALLGNVPIKTEHSYSLNSDGDSMPDSPRSLHAKIDDMEDECYPAISMKTATSNTRRHQDHSAVQIFTTQLQSSVANSINRSSNQLLSSVCHPLTTTAVTTASSHIAYSTAQLKLNLRANSQNQNLRDSVSSTSFSDIELDDSCIKDEPMSPESSCPPSPQTQTYANGMNININNMASVAAITNSDLVFEHKNGSLQLSNASQSLLKSQQFILGATGQSIVIPKVIKVESQSQQLFGLPPTPPSSLPSDESEGNQSPDHHLLSPMSPPTSTHTSQISVNSATSASSSTSSSPTSSTSNTPRRSAGNATNTSASHGSSSGGRGYTGSSTRQPIHTPLISSQPKGSTGTLILTEEEKRTLLAEGYPIPTRLPLTKAEEKSLKKIRRKIKNKISAQESRRKKKEYMDQLERKVEILVSENTDYKKRVENLEDSNASLLSQLQKLQAMVNKQNKRN